MTETPARPQGADLDWCRKLHQAGMLQDAIAGYRSVLDHDSENPAVWHALGMALLADGACAEAVDHLKTAARLDPSNADVWNDLGVALEGTGALDEAESAFRRAIALDADLAEANRSLAVVLIRDGRGEEAAAILDPMTRDGNPDAVILLSRALMLIAESASDAAEALNAAQRAVDAAVDSGDAALIAGAHQACFTIAGRCADIDMQRRMVEQLAFLQPDTVAAHNLRGRAAAVMDQDFASAADAFDRALAIDPENLEAQWLRCFLALRPIYRDADEIARRRTDYGQRLADLRERLHYADKSELVLTEALIGTMGPAFLPYQGEDDRDLQALYGAMIAEVMLSRHPVPPPVSRPAENGRIRVAFVSDVVYNHSNWKLRRGWLRHLDRTRFHVSVYHLGQRTDWLTDEIRKACDAFHHITEGFDAALTRLRDDAPQILVYLNIGLSVSVLKLAALRIAPVQCTTWGHPVTSGLPTIDDFLSSELMEPEDGGAHYTERLVRLPGLSIAYDPVFSGEAAADRAGFGLDTDAVVYLAVQSLQKYLPRHDEIFPQIAAQMPNAQFVFIDGPIERVANAMRLRLDTAFRRHGLDRERHLRFLPKQPFERFQALCRSADIFLDSLEWSGANTTLEALQWDLPVVTMAGRFMRGRHSAGILRFIGLEQCVAQNQSEFVALAAGLGKDPALRDAVRGVISGVKPKLAQDRTAIDGLMAYFEQAAEGVRPEQARPLADPPMRRQLGRSEDGLYRRRYATYDEYLTHQREKIRHLDLSDYDIAFEAELGARLGEAGLVKRGDNVLCLGARLGSECRAFIALGAFAIGIDLNPGRGNPHVVVGDFHDPQFADESVDLVYTNCLDHSFDLEKVMAGVDRVLKPGGGLIVDVMNGSSDPDPWRADGYDCLFWDKSDDVIDTLRAITGFAVERDHPMKSAWGWPGRMVVFRKA
ncbi:MAG: tetratricopeptide repeat protein [Alphaproteobacteria bacterium]|nr:tetratricopeptide repeat protein [Alphaproteobacteria bacterium]